MNGDDEPRERILKLIADVCLARDGRDRLRELEALLDEHGITGDDRSVLLAEGRRLGVYRTLVRNNLVNVLCRAFPRTRRLWNANADDAFDDAVVAFLDAGGPRSALLRDAPGEFAAHVQAGPAPAQLPGWAAALLAFELSLFTLDAAEAPTAQNVSEPLGLDSRVEVAQGVAAQTSAWPLHELSADGDDVDVPPQRDASFVLSRDADGVVWTTATDGLTVQVVRALAEGKTLGEAVRQSAERANVALSPDVLAGIAQTLALLASRGAFIRITTAEHVA